MMEEEDNRKEIEEKINGIMEPVLLRGAADAWCQHKHAWSMREFMMEWTMFTGRVRIKYEKPNRGNEMKDRQTEFVYSEETQSTIEAMPMVEFLVRLLLTMSAHTQGWMARWLSKTFARDASAIKVYMQALMDEEMERRIGIGEMNNLSRQTNGDDEHSSNCSNKTWLWRLISRKGMETTQARKIWISAGGSVTVRLEFLMIFDGSADQPRPTVRAPPFSLMHVHVLVCALMNTSTCT